VPQRSKINNFRILQLERREEGGDQQTWGPIMLAMSGLQCGLGGLIELSLHVDILHIQAQKVLDFTSNAFSAVIDFTQ
jgi:hypothetical protein